MTDFPFVNNFLSLTINGLRAISTYFAGFIFAVTDQFVICTGTE